MSLRILLILLLLDLPDAHDSSGLKVPVVGVVVDNDEATSVCAQAVSHPAGWAAIDSRDVVPGLDSALNLRTVQQAPLAPLLSVLCPDEAFDHSRRSYGALGTVFGADVRRDSRDVRPPDK